MPFHLRVAWLVRLFVLLCFGLGGSMAPRPVYAQIITVTTTAEAPGASGDCTLGEAMQAAQTDAAVDACPAGTPDDTIVLQPGAAYTLTAASVDALGPTAFVISTTVTLEGNGATLVRGGPADAPLRFFIVAPAGSLALKHVTLRGGLVRGADGADAGVPGNPGEDGGDAFGGALYNTGTVVLDGVRFEANTARSGDGGQGSGAGEGGEGGLAYGGAVLNQGTLLIEGAGAVFAGNQVLGGAGGGGQPGGDGGLASASALVNLGTLEALAPTLFEHNLAQAGAGGSATLPGAGGIASSAVSNGGQARLHGAVFRYNTTLGGAGGFGLGAPGEGGDVLGGVLSYGAGALTLTHSLVFSNTAQAGSGSPPGELHGGVFLQTFNVESWLTAVRVISNTARGGNATGNIQHVGGSALGTFTVYQGVSHIAQSALAGNVLLPGASHPATTTLGASGGGGLYALGGSVRLTNTTFAHNTATQGSALAIQAPLTLTHVTVAHNTSTGGFSAIATTGDFLWLYNSIVAHNSGSNCNSPNQSAGSANLQYPGDTCGPNVTVADPLLGPLTELGGTPHLPLLTASPARDTAAGACPPVDQRGFARPIGAACDLGAIEAWGALFLPFIKR